MTQLGYAVNISSKKGTPSMHSFARHRHREVGSTPTQTTKGLVLHTGQGYDLGEWFQDLIVFRGQLRTLRQRTIALAGLQSGEQALDVGCGTGTLALLAARRVGRTGSVVGIDPGREQIAHARAKAARRRMPITFQVGVIEQLAYPDQTFDVVFSTLMMHHLPAPLKQQGLTEIARVLKTGGRLIIADFTHKQERTGQATRFHAGGSRIQDLEALLKESGFGQMKTEELPPLRFSAFPGASIIRAYKS
jgi:ubiquinone/menaquinone biosynthesis C-methylase UbiE